MFPKTSRLRALYFLYFSTPRGDRRVYQAICRQKARKFLELGIGIGQRAARMIEVAARFFPPSEIRYIGMDPFEARSALDGPGVTLKMAHRLLSSTGGRIRLIPGDPLASLANSANALGQVDLIVISARLDPRRLAKGWLYIPRLLHEESKVFLEKTRPGGQTSLEAVARSEVLALASLACDRRAA